MFPLRENPFHVKVPESANDGRARGVPLPEATLPASVLESLADALLVTSLTGEVLYLNTSAKRLLGVNLNTARARTLAEVLTLLDGATRKPLGSPLARILARCESQRRGELDLLVRGDGTEIPVETNCAMVHDRHGETVALALTLRDATYLHELAHDATHDPLTRLLNRQEFERRLTRLLAGVREGEMHALLYMDLDRFKAINDTHGHAAGDFALRQTVAVFLAAVRHRDMLARLGGDEFALLLEHCPLALAESHARALERALDARPFCWQDQTFRLGVSIGAVAITARDRDPAAVLAAADRACYAAKRRRTVAPASNGATGSMPGFFPWTLV